MDPMDLIQDKFSQDCTIETVLHLLMAHFELSEEEAQTKINEYFEMKKSINHVRIDKQNKKVYNKSAMISKFEIYQTLNRGDRQVCCFYPVRKI